VPKAVNLLMLKAEFYDRRKIQEHGGITLDVSLPIERCKRYGIEKGSIMRVIATKDVFIVLPETTYLSNPMLRIQIENFFSEVKPEEHL
jgi:phosphate uptake regulator